ncbi:D-alanine--D-alanine ligase [Marinomonas agarivorans]|nr:D-alanine--D-alanine ligase [Marinomonas agarivorans]
MKLTDLVIAVIYGGRSAERPVSLESGKLIARSLEEKGYRVIDIDLYGENADQDPIKQLQAIEFDMAFIALHGGEGEDGRVQALLELMEKPYTGSSPLACGFAMDKVLTKKYWQGIGLPTPEYLAFSGQIDIDKIEATLPYPVIVKPACEGSTFGITKANNRTELNASLAKALSFDSDILVERFINGPEYTITIIGESAYPVIGLKPSSDHELYDYEAKYIADDTEYLLPSGLTAEEEKYVQKISLEAYLALGCKGWGRVDVMRDKQGEFWLLEVNTAPGMTSHSLVPMSAAHAGISYTDLVDHLVSETWQAATQRD